MTYDSDHFEWYHGRTLFHHFALAKEATGIKYDQFLNCLREIIYQNLSLSIIERMIKHGKTGPKFRFLKLKE